MRPVWPLTFAVCFPVASLDQLPDPNNESNWRWNASDRFFHAMIAGGFAPFLKLGVNTWTSTRISGQAYVNWTTGNVTYVIPPKAYDILRAVASHFTCDKCNWRPGGIGTY